MRNLLLSIACALVATPAFAALGTISSTTANQSAGFSAGQGGRFEFGGLTVTGLTTDQLAPSLSADGQKLYSFCIELGENLRPFTNAAVTVLTDAPQNAGPGPNGEPMTAVQAAALEILVDNYFQTAIRAGTVAIGAVTPSFGGSDSAQAAAFQLAIWNLVFNDSGSTGFYQGGGGSFDASSGTVISYGSLNSSTVKANAKTLIDLIGSTWTDILKTKTFAVVDSTPATQDQIIQLAVPEATSLLVFASMTGALGSVAMRRRRN